MGLTFASACADSMLPRGFSQRLSMANLKRRLPQMEWWSPKPRDTGTVLTGFRMLPRARICDPESPELFQYFLKGLCKSSYDVFSSPVQDTSSCCIIMEQGHVVVRGRLWKTKVLPMRVYKYICCVQVAKTTVPYRKASYISTQDSLSGIHLSY